MPRRAVLLGITALVSSPFVAAAGVAYAHEVEPGLLQVTETTLSVARLPAGLNGLRIAHLSDLHIGPFVDRAHIRRAVALTNAQHPDLVVLTGDFVYHSTEQMHECAEELAGLTPAAGTCAVLGNHDVWTSADTVSDILTAVGVRVLGDSRIALESGEARLWLLGIEDRGYSGFSGGDSSEFNRRWQSGFVALEQSLVGIGDAEARLLLVHNPDFCEMLVPGMVDLALCGHTHGGQVRLPLVGSPVVPSSYGQKYACGLVQGPGCPVYVTRGIGVTPPAVRFSCRPEVSMLTLVTA